jgi:hypothetical protein
VIAGARFIQIVVWFGEGERAGSDDDGPGDDCRGSRAGTDDDGPGSKWSLRDPSFSGIMMM